MMILRSSPASPYGRKISLAIALLGLDHRIRKEKADTNDPSDPLRAENPLGKIPVLVSEDGKAVYDSRVILEYLDHLAGGGRIIPAEAVARFRALTLQALADGIMDASLLQVYEGRWRAPEKQDARWVDHQAGKVARALALLEDAPPVITDPPDVGQIAVASALGYLDLRFGGDWRAGHPNLVAWLDRFAAAVPAFAATRIDP